MLDKNRVLSKLDELDSYINELESVMPKSYEEYVNSIEKKRSCERLLHILIPSFTIFVSCCEKGRRDSCCRALPGQSEEGGL